MYKTNASIRYFMDVDFSFGAISISILSDKTSNTFFSYVIANKWYCCWGVCLTEIELGDKLIPKLY